jgi:predicted transcriptional regulator
MPSSVLFSIKPEFVEKIFSGKKKYEFRRTFCRRPISKIYIYATSPVCKIVGHVTVVEILSDEPSQLWKATAQFAGLSKKQYDNYFSQCKIAYAYHLFNPLLYTEPIALSNIQLAYPPQSFYYLNEEQQTLLFLYEQNIKP